MTEENLLLKHIKPDEIQKAILYKRGLPAKMAVLKAFGCDIRLVQEISQLAFYCREPVKYFEVLKEDEEDPRSEFKENNPKTLSQHKVILEHRELLQHLTKKLLSEVDSVRYKNSNLLEIHDECEDIDADEIYISYESLYHWFLTYSINVTDWENLASFQKQKLGEINVGKKKRNTPKAENTQTAILAITILTLAESKRNFKKSNSAPNVDALTAEIHKNSKKAFSKGTIKRYIDSAFEYYSEHC